MKNLLSLEELFLALLSAFLFRSLNFVWWLLPLFILAPDLGMLGYLAGPRAGAFTYNLVHHKAMAVSLYVAGSLIGNPWLQFAGLIILAHSSLDRMLGYGLKYPDSFKHTHLGMLGGAAEASS